MSSRIGQRENRAKTMMNSSMYKHPIFLVVALALIIVISVQMSAGQEVGVGWDSQDSTISNNINGIESISSTSAYAVSDNGNIIRTDDGGNWTIDFAIPNTNLFDIEAEGSFIFVSGEAGAVYRSNLSTVWTDVSIPTSANIYSLSIVEINSTNINQTVVFAAGESGEIWNSTNGGVTWTSQTTEFSDTIYSIDMLNELTGLAVGENGATLGTITGKNWELRSTLSDSSIVLRSVGITKTRAYIVGDKGTLLKSSTEDNPIVGFVWNELDIIDDETNQTIDVQLNSIYLDSRSKFWIVGNNGTVLLSKDGGASFSLQKTEIQDDPIDLNDVVIINKEIGWIAGNNGIILYTDREGIAEIDRLKIPDYNNYFNFLELAVPILNEGFVGMIKVIFISMIFGFILGVIFAVMKTIPNRLLILIGTVYTDIFRNTPLLVQLFIIHFGLRQVTYNPWYFRFADGVDWFYGVFEFLPIEFVNGIIGLSLNSGAYQTEIIRSGILAIPRGQMEAGRSVGLTYPQTMKNVILPQALRITIPPLGNEIVNLTLNSSLLFIIGYFELTRAGNLIIATTFLNFETWILVLLYYFAVTYPLTQVLKFIEVKTKIPGLGAQ